MATNTSKTYLVKKTTVGGSTTLNKLCDIKDYPDLMGTNEQLEVTTLSDTVQKFIDGIKTGDKLEFLANYDKTDYSTIKALEGTELDLAVVFDGSDTNGVITVAEGGSEFEFKGYISIKVNGGSVNAVREMSLSVNVSSEVTLAD